VLGFKPLSTDNQAMKLPITITGKGNGNTLFPMEVGTTFKEGLMDAKSQYSLNAPQPVVYVTWEVLPTQVPAIAVKLPKFLMENSAGSSRTSAGRATTTEGAALCLSILACWAVCILLKCAFTGSTLGVAIKTRTKFIKQKTYKLVTYIILSTPTNKYVSK
jgi:hypothetical protein